MCDRTMGNPFSDMPVIFAYSRAQAIEDGVLIDLTEWAKETGFRFPVACTTAVWNGYIAPNKDLRLLGQSERGRAHDVLWMLLCAIRRGSGDRIDFETLFLQSPYRRITARFKAVCGPGDNGRAVITIMLPNED
jgi:hypothetical protein